ncbi:hypothetical protein FH975_12015 [Nesterenkonia sp. Hz 6-5]|nr:hypothetical protein [Nesterenkonia haasae]
MEDNGRMAIPPRQKNAPHVFFWRGAPVALTLLLGLGYLIGDGIVEDVAAESVNPWLLSLLVLAQAALLVVRHQVPMVALLAISALDAVLILMSSGEAGAGTFAVMVAVYTYVRQRPANAQLLIPTGVAVLSTVLTLLAVQTSVEILAEWAVPFAVFRGAFTFGLPVILAKIFDGRARLIRALRDRADAAERERERLAEDAVRAERALMARELHDIAAHHLTGIIVSAQAADALSSTDPEDARTYIRRVEGDARTALSNLRQTVGLLRSESGSAFSPTPAIEHLPALISEACENGTPVAFSASGDPKEIGPLAGMAVYRMVQESLANSSQHAPGAPRSVELDYGADSMRVSVHNGPAQTERPSNEPDRDGFGLQGMSERADLIGAQLRTGPTPDGGWSNVLEIPYDKVRA